METEYEQNMSMMLSRCTVDVIEVHDTGDAVQIYMYSGITRMVESQRGTSAHYQLQKCFSALIYRAVS